MQNTTVPVHILVTAADFDLAAEYAAARCDSTNPGAIVTFSGLVREVYSEHSCDDQDQTLTLEHYPGMTEQALKHIAEQAVARWPLQSVRIIHRVGTLLPADQIVLVICSSAHRHAAFESAEFIMDYLKTSAPFWKKQIRGDESYWVDSRESDYQAMARWQTGTDQKYGSK
jgi:molybdopterin synthase catalytic subunit